MATAVDRRDGSQAPDYEVNTELDIHPVHWVGVIGAAVSGAKTASLLAENGIRVLVFEQNHDPFGKVRRGLPFWHDRQQQDEEEKIVAQLSHPNIYVIPNTGIGREIPFETLETLGLSAVVIATGAERDKPSPIAGIETYKGKGFFYQNDYIQQMNDHFADPANRLDDGSVDWQTFPADDDALVQGGGLASVDVAKAIMYIRTAQELQKKGLRADIVDMDKRGIPEVLNEYKISGLEALGIRPCTLLYYMNKERMPMDAQRRWQVSEKLLKRAQGKALFLFEDHQESNGFESDDEGITAMTFTKESKRQKISTKMFVSSLGSVNRIIEGLPADEKGTKYILDDEGVIFQNKSRVFAAGNAATQEGNIIASRNHAIKAADKVTASLSFSEQVQVFAEDIKKTPLPSMGVQQAIRQFTTEHQQRVGYPGNMHDWLNLNGTHSSAAAQSESVS